MIEKETSIKFKKERKTKNKKTPSPNEARVKKKGSCNPYKMCKIARKCSQPSSARVEPRAGGTAERPGRDGTAQCSPSSSVSLPGGGRCGE